MRFSFDFEPNSDSCDSFFELGRISALSCGDRSVYRGKREAISLPTVGQSYEPTALNAVLFPS